MSIVLAWSALLGTYLLFAGRMSLDEIATGLVLATLVTIWGRAIRRTSQRSFKLPAVGLQAIARGVIKLIPGTFEACRSLLRISTGDMRPAHFEDLAFAIGDGSAEDRGRRALAMLLGSWAPDRFVVDLDGRHQKVLMHSIVPFRQGLDPRWLT